jgi:hypothetical protein
MPWRNSPEDRARSSAVYQDPEYKRNRKLAAERANGRCEGCHHRHPRLQCDHRRNTGNGPPDHSLANLQMLCAGGGSCRCHEKKTAQEGGGYRNRKPHDDPPLQQRTTW